MPIMQRVAITKEVNRQGLVRLALIPAQRIAALVDLDLAKAPQI
jgi:hypothetical protein